MKIRLEKERTDERYVFTITLKKMTVTNNISMI